MATLRDNWFVNKLFPKAPSKLTPDAEGLIKLDPIRFAILEKNVKKINGMNTASSTLTPEQYKNCESLIEGFANPHSLIGKYNGPKDNLTAYHVSAAYASLYSQVQRQRQRIYDRIEKTSEFYLVDVILDTIVEDSLTPDVHSGEIFELKSKNSKIQKELDYLDKRFKLDHLVRTFLPDALKFGEYTFSAEVRRDPKVRTEEEMSLSSELAPISEDYDTERPPPDEFGLLELNDTVDQTTVIPITKDHEIDFYLQVEHFGGNTHIKQVPRTEYVRFSLNHQKIRVDLQKEFDALTPAARKIIAGLPRFIRIGKSVLYPVLGKFRELELLEQLVPATKLSKLSSGTILGVQVPAGYEINQGMEACEQIEGVLNKKVAVDTTSDQIQLADILASSGQLKVVPIFGDKGRIEKLDVRGDDPDNLTADAEVLRSLILDSIGIPFELIYKGQSPESKGELLKRYARYLRRLKNVQRAIIDFLYQIVSIHFANKGIEWARKDVEISFRNKLVELDNIDKLEFLDTAVGMLTNVNNFVNELADADTSKISSAVQLPKYVEYLEEQFSLMGLKGLIDPKKFVEPPPDEPDEVLPPGSGDDEEEPEKTPPPKDDK